MPCCQVCNKTLSSTDAVLAHLNAAHPSAMLASFVPSQRGRALLVHHDYVYTLKHSFRSRHRWECDQRRMGTCKAHALTHGATSDDLTSIVVRATQHDHPPSPASVKVHYALAQLRRKALESDASALMLRQQLFTAVEPEVAALLPSESGMRRYINRWRANRKKTAL